MDSMPIRFAIVAGEESGDILGANLIRALKERFPEAEFEGIGGKRMCEQGLRSLFPLERLSVMGFFEPLKRLPELIKIFYTLKKRFLSHPPTAFIGIDAPDFNLRLEKSLKSSGIKTVHYVSPTVWAWRPGRIHTIKQSVDLMLGIFPFEKAIYDSHQIPMQFVGHPLADIIPLTSDKQEARQRLQLDANATIVALLPGSRKQELHYLLEPFLRTAQWLQARENIQFITACANEKREQEWKEALLAFESVSVKIIQGNAIDVMSASDAILCASGTATLQCMLVKRPTIIAYKMSPVTYWLAKRLIKVPFIGLPNLLAENELMPEYIQSDVIPEKMGESILSFLQNGEKSDKLIGEFERLHRALKQNAGYEAALAIEKII